MFPILLWNWSHLSLFVILLMLPVLVLIIISRTSSKSQLPPCPPRLPILGNLHQVGSLPHQSLHALSNKHGSLMLLKLGQIPTLVFSSADMAREIMKIHDHIFASRPSSKTSDILLYGGRGVGFGPYSAHWRQMRKLCVNHLLSNKMVQSFRFMRKQVVESMITNISKISLSSGVVNMSEILSLYSTNVLINAISGECFREGRSRVVHELIEENIVILGQFNISDLFPSLGWLDGIFGMGARAKRVAKRWDNVFDEIIEEHTNRSNEMEDTDGQEEKTNFVNVLLAIQKDSNMDFNINRDIIKALLQDMIAAGIETSYIVLDWGMAELVRNTEAMKKLQEEVIIDSQPLTVAILAALLFGESIGAIGAAGLVLGVVGLLLLEVPALSFEGGDSTIWGSGRMVDASCSTKHGYRDCHGSLGFQVFRSRHGHWMAYGYWWDTFIGDFIS